MTIYIVQYSGPKEEDADSIFRRSAFSSYTNAKTFYTAKRAESYLPDSDVAIEDEDEALTKHVISTQKEVIDLINKLN